MRFGKQLAMALKTANTLHGEKRLHQLKTWLDMKQKYSSRNRLIPNCDRV